MAELDRGGRVANKDRTLAASLSRYFLLPPPRPSRPFSPYGRAQASMCSSLSRLRRSTRHSRVLDSRSVGSATQPF
eukprot:3024049-Rhodomonas_salina.1